MRRLLLGCLLLFAAGCTFAAAGAGASDNYAWAFTINNTLPPGAVYPGGGGGLVVIITYQDGSSASYVVASGSSLVVNVDNGATAVVHGGGSSATVKPGASLFYTAGGWSPAPPAPTGSG